MLAPVRSRQFKRDARRAEKRGKDLSKLRVLLAALLQQEPLPARFSIIRSGELGRVIGRLISSRTGF